MKRIILLTLVMVFIMVASSNAALLGLKPSLPDIFSDSTGTYNYAATSDLLSFSATALTITFDGTTNIPILNGSYSASFYVNNTGSFESDKSGISIYGDFAYGGTDYSGLLIAGDVTGFGYEGPFGSNKTMLFDFSFTPTDGALKGLFWQGYNITTAERTNFANWNTNHGNVNGGRVKHDTTPVPEPSTLLLLGAGLLGLGFAARRRK